ncbi:MAG: NADH-quinone oxidoreductase subunit NuoK [Chloroflexi bacterium]|uniref:NADH-quinone oxidoreductase subunit K n=1 Tax=Candidatus Chlorohelix allophototropha TaxID=3003348 RepID=A0A8T7M0F0_9CHLR|nr:NADH-quinone oxidoreductase subunit NuoK [Chloroflexota bacterium]WJW66713.1 NADH-quinone oxidoreductase subunit NuoK [Chloroflexota bacterium L227-S17]
MIPTAWFLILSGVLFSIGLTGVLMRRNVLVIFMCVELMMNAVNITFVAFARSFTKGINLAGDNFVVFVVTVAAAEAAVGLAIIVSLATKQSSVDADSIGMLKD